MDEQELRRQFEWLKKDHARLEEENRSLALRTEGAQVLGDVLKQSTQQKNEMKQKYTEMKKTQVKPKQTEPPAYVSNISDALDAKRLNMSQKSTVSQMLDSLDASPWNTTDAEKMKSASLDITDDDITGLKTDLKELELTSQSRSYEIQKPPSEPVSPAMEVKFSKIERLSPDLKFPKYDSLDDLYANELEKKESFVKEKVPSVKPRTDYKEVLELKKLNAELSSSVTQLQGQIECLQSEKTEMVKVNHAWEAQYRKLQEHTRNELKNRDNSFQNLQKQLSQEHKKYSAADSHLLEQKDATIEEQAEKIRSLNKELSKIRLDSMTYMQNKYENDLEMRYQRAKKLFQDERKEKELLAKREQTVVEECQMLKEEYQITKEQCDRLKDAIQKLKSRNKILENELQRLASLVEEFASGKREITESRSSPASLMLETRPGTRRQDSAVSAEQIEVLKQQIAIYAEDFNSEKEEKDGLVAENKRLKERLRDSERETEECKRQMQLYENDFRLEREERGRYSRMKQADPFQDIKEPPGYSSTNPTSPDLVRQCQEYCQLVVAKDKMNNRISQLERLGVDKYLQRRGDLFFNPIGYNARGSPKPQAPENCKPEDSMFYGGDVVPDGLWSSNDRTTKTGENITCRFCKIQLNDAGELLRHRNFCHKK